jgi:hypothetical protein
MIRPANVRFTPKLNTGNTYRFARFRNGKQHEPSWEDEGEGIRLASPPVRQPSVAVHENAT